MYLWLDERWQLHQRVADMLAGAVMMGGAMLLFLAAVVLVGIEVLLQRSLGISLRDVVRHWRG